MDRWRVARIGVTILLVVVVLPFVLTAVPQVVGADESYVVVSGSMEPTISPGDVVVVRSVNPDRIKQGALITFEQQGGEVEQVTHRVVEVVTRDGERYFRTRGDAMEDPDRQLVPASAVIGRVIFYLPYVGHVVLFAQSWVGFVALLVVPVGLLISSELWSLAQAAGGPPSKGAENEL